MESTKRYKISPGTYIIKFRRESLIYNKKNYNALKLSKKANDLLKKIIRGNFDINPDPDFNKLILALKSKGLIEDTVATTKSGKKSLCFIENKTDPHLNRIMIEITNGCNLRCKHCYVLARKYKPQILSYGILNKIITEIEKIGVWQLDLTGGEIASHPEILKILDRVQDTHLLVNLFSNLSIDNQKFLDAVVASKPKLVITSIDGNNAAIHDSFRGVNGAFDRTVKNIRYLQSEGVPVRVNVSLSKNNYKNLKDIVAFIKKEIKVPFIIGDIQCTDPATKEILISREKVVESIVKYQSDIYTDRKKEEIDDSKKIHPACGVGYDFCFINSSGEVSLCPTLTKEESKDFYAGSILTNSLFNIWEKSEAFKKYFGSQCYKIDDCKYGKYCKGGCRSRAYLENNKIDDIDPVNCSVIKKLYGKAKN